MATPSFQGQIKLDIGQTGTYSELTKATNLTLDADGQEISVEELGDKGTRIILGRASVQVDVSFNLDLTVTQQRDLFTTSKDDSEKVDVRIFPDRNNSEYIQFTGNVTSASIDVPESDSVGASATIMNADGNEWTTSW